MIEQLSDHDPAASELPAAVGDMTALRRVAQDTYDILSVVWQRIGGRMPMLGAPVTPSVGASGSSGFIYEFPARTGNVVVPGTTAYSVPVRTTGVLEVSGYVTGSEHAQAAIVALSTLQTWPDDGEAWAALQGATDSYVVGAKTDDGQHAIFELGRPDKPSDLEMAGQVVDAGGARSVVEMYAEYQKGASYGAQFIAANLSVGLGVVQ